MRSILRLKIRVRQVQTWARPRGMAKTSVRRKDRRRARQELRLTRR